MAFKLSSTLLILILCAGETQAEILSRQIPVAETHPKISQMRGPHEVYWSSKAPGKNLLITFGGTNSLPSDLKAFAETAVSLGMDVVTVDYDNSVISTTCKDSTDNQCFDKFRDEIATGKNVSPLIHVDQFNSLEFRLQELLKYLARSEPARWKKYLSEGKVQWKSAVIAGHSQGSGHAAYLAKTHPLKGVVMLAGPQDRFEDGRAVPWLRLPSKTSPAKYFSLLHKKDFFGSEYQVAAMKILLGSETTGDHIIMREDVVQDPHNSVLLKRFSDQWTILLQKAAR